MAQNRHSYTIIELIVVLGIAAVVFGMSISSFDVFNETKKLDEESEVFKSKLEEVFKKTTSGDLIGDVGCKKNAAAVSNMCDSYKYIFKVPATTTYALDFYCDCPGTESPDNVTQTLYTRIMPAIDRITLSPIAATYTFERGTVTTGCINIRRNTRVNRIDFNFPGNVSLAIGSSCP